jgi:glyoxylase-like metal-dependent hydrolase (beta-lactamase superfamily II)
MQLPLEDALVDMVGKAQRGLGLSDAAIADKAAVPLSVWEALKDGQSIDPQDLAALCGVLALHAPSLAAIGAGQWRPEPVSLDGLAQFTTTFGDMTVNSYLVYDEASAEAAAFDTGATAEPILAFLRQRGLKLRALFLTHTHADHVADIAALNAPEVWVSTHEPHETATIFEPGQCWQIGKLAIESRLTWGHSRGGTTFVVKGLARPVAVVGDALFAGSMGGGGVSFADALATNRKEIFSLPDSTVLAPGHGPLSSVGEERLNNPFYPEFKTAAAR